MPGYLFHLCKALAHPTRLLIIDELRDGPRSVGDLVERLGLRQSNLSQHLGILRDQRLVITRRDGQTVYYRLRDPRVTQAFDLLRQVLRSVLREGERLAGAADVGEEAGAGGITVELEGEGSGGWGQGEGMRSIVLSYGTVW